MDLDLGNVSSDLDSSDEDYEHKLYEKNVGEAGLERLNFEEDSDEGVGENVELDKRGVEFLEFAQQGNTEAMVKSLKDRPDLISFKDSDHYTALHRAAYSEQPRVIELLLDLGANISARTLEGWVPLHSACRWNSAKCVHVLLKNGADINAKTTGGLTPLHIAAENAVARETLSILLLNPKLDPDIPNSSGETGETIASQHGSFAYLFELVRKSIINI